MNVLHTVDHALTRAGTLLSFPPPPFLTGLFAGLLCGILLTVLVLRRASVARALLCIGKGIAVLAPPVIACLLWGAWIGIMAAKEIVH
jgi:hypothetical protein